ncbi:MAG TPA: hypothetical protein VMW23_02980 [Sedimentisphaerales bacterium]|nr:hypothetical protein [Sedimentisphaerales bacterium]
MAEAAICREVMPQTDRFAIQIGRNCLLKMCSITEKTIESAIRRRRIPQFCFLRFDFCILKLTDGSGQFE